MMRKYQVRFDGSQTKKEQQCHLVGWLPTFNQHSFGFRPGRGCHTALGEIDKTWTGVKWFLEGDIAGYFENIDHEVLMSILSERIQDNRFLRLIRYLLKAGYLEDWRAPCRCI